MTGPSVAPARHRTSLWIAGLLVAVVPTAVLVWLRNRLDAGQQLSWLAKLLYLTMPIVVAVAAAAWGWRWHRSQASLWSAGRRLWPGLLSALVLTAAVFWLVPPAMRVQFDETSLVGCSQNMHLQRAALMTTGAVPFEGGIVALENTVDKRPPLFAFLVSVVHDVSGYRVENAFVVNAGLLALALLLVFAAVRARLSLVAAFAAQLALLAVPLTSVVATSAGFELLAAVLFLVVLLAALDFVHEPDTVRWVALLASGVLFAQSRYESLLAVGLTGLLALWAVRGRWRRTPGAWLATAACPVLLTPLAFLLLHARDANFYPEAGGRALVAWQYGIDHLRPMLAAWFAPSLDNPLPGVLAILGVLAWLLRWKQQRAGRDDVLVVAPVLAVTAIVLFWFYGDVREPTALRLFLPLAWLSALAPICLAGLFAPRPYGLRPGQLLLVGMLGLAGVRLVAVHEGRAFPPLRFAQLTKTIDELLQRPEFAAKTTLWVGTPAQHFIIRGRAALSAQSFAGHQRDVQELLRGGHIESICVLETPIDAAMAPAFGEPAEVLRHNRWQVVLHTEGEMPITVHRWLR